MIAAGTFFSLKDAPQVDLPLPAVTAEAPQTTRYLTKSIEDLRPISDRVLADNPEIDGPAQTQFEQIDEKNLRLLTLNLTKPDGTEMEAVIARSIPWINDVLLSNNGQVPIGTKELAVMGLADVVRIDPCPPKSTGQGRLVTGIYRHYANNVIDLQISSASRPIETTDNHPFWSEDRQQFVPAGDLQPGEHLRLRSGATSIVKSIGPTKRSARHHEFTEVALAISTIPSIDA